MSNYLLKHKDIDTAVVSFDDNTGSIQEFTVLNREHMPLSATDNRHFQRWWEGRAVPHTRTNAQKLLQEAGYKDLSSYLMANLALGLNDCYWICPLDQELSWDEVNLYDNRGWEDAEISFNNTSRTPNAALSGNMEKYWIHQKNGEIALLKYGDSYDSQQCINEVIASRMHDLQGFTEHAQYDLIRTYDHDGQERLACVSPLFTSKKRELVTAIDLVESGKKRNDVSYYEYLIQLGTENGLKEDYVRHFLEYMLLSDFVLTNNDRHFHNFGILRDPDTLQFVSMAPLYDTGNSLFYNIGRTLDIEGMLSLPITSFRQHETEQLRYILDRTVLDPNRIFSPKAIRNIMMHYGISEERAGVISENYQTKLGLYEEFIQGRTLSRYQASFMSIPEQKAIVKQGIDKGLNETDLHHHIPTRDEIRRQNLISLVSNMTQMATDIHQENDSRICIHAACLPGIEIVVSPHFHVSAYQNGKKLDTVKLYASHSEIGEFLSSVEEIVRQSETDKVYMEKGYKKNQHREFSLDKWINENVNRDNIGEHKNPAKEQISHRSNSEHDSR